MKKQDDDDTRSGDKIPKQAVDGVQEKWIGEPRPQYGAAEFITQEMQVIPLSSALARRNDFDFFLSAPVGYFIFDPQGVILGANPAGAQLLGFEHSRLAHMQFSRFVDLNSRNRFLQHLEATIGAEAHRRCELTLRRENGTLCHVLMECIARRAQNRARTSIISVIIDITQEVQARDAMRASEEKYRMLFDQMASGAILLDLPAGDEAGDPTDARIVEINPAFERITGLSRDQVLGKSILEIWPRQRDHWFQRLAKTARNGCSTEVIRCDRFDRYYAVTACWIKPSRAAAAFIDISEQKHMEESIQKAVDALEIRVAERTAALQKANAELRQEIEMNQITQRWLEEKSDELKARASELAEANTALKVLLRQREIDRSELKEKIICNINELVRPYLNKLAAKRLGNKDKALLDVVQKNLDDLASPLPRRLITELGRLSPTETQVVNLVRQGKSTKDIAELMGVAQSTIDFHRHNIRRKLNLSKKSLNLRTYLNTIE